MCSTLLKWQIIWVTNDHWWYWFMMWHLLNDWVLNNYQRWLNKVGSNVILTHRFVKCLEQACGPRLPWVWWDEALENKTTWLLKIWFSSLKARQGVLCHARRKAIQKAFIKSITVFQNTSINWLPHIHSSHLFDETCFHHKLLLLTIRKRELKQCWHSRAFELF